MSDYALETTVYLPFTTRAFATGIPTALVSGEVQIYEDASVTQITGAETLTVSLDGVAGFNMIAVAATAANGFEAGKSYTAMLAAGTVSSVSVIGEVVGHITIEMTAALRPTIAGRTLDVSATGEAGADIIMVSGDTGAADNLELQFDGTGYSDPSAPATQSQVDNIGAASGGSVNIEATEDNTGGAIDPSGALFAGSVQGATTYANTESEDGVLHDIDDTANDIDIVYGFSVGGFRAGTAVSFAGFCQGVGDEMKISAYDHVGAGWDVIGTIDGQVGTANVTIEPALLLKHTGTGAELGKVYIRIDTQSTTPSNLSVDKLLVSAVNTSTSIGYAEGAVWVDTVNGASGTVDYVNGVADNPSDSWASAQTIATSIGVKKFKIAAGSSITLDNSSDSFVLIGESWTLALGTQSIDGAFFSGASVTGTGEATATQPTFEDCKFGAATVPPALLYGCGIGDASGTFTAAIDAGQYVLRDCYSLAPGAASPVFDFSPVNGASGINVRRWAGGATYTLDANCTLSHEVVAGGGTTVTTGGGDVEIRGVTRSLTVTMSAAETVQFAGITGPIALSGTTTATVNLYGVADVVTDTTSAATVANKTVSQGTINAEVDTGISDASLATAAELTKVPKSDGTASWNATALAAINAEADTAISDAFTFSVANQVDATVKSVVATTVTGTGASGDEWGP